MFPDGIRRTFSASVSHPLPNFARKAANLPASSSSTFSSFCELGFHSGAFRMSFALLYTGCGLVVRSVKELPSDSVMSCVKVYGRFGRLRSVAWRTWVVGRTWGCIECRSARRAPIEGIGEAIACGMVVVLRLEMKLDKVRTSEMCRCDAWRQTIFLASLSTLPSQRHSGRPCRPPCQCALLNELNSMPKSSL